MDDYTYLAPCDRCGAGTDEECRSSCLTTVRVDSKWGHPSKGLGITMSVSLNKCDTVSNNKQQTKGE